MSTKVRAKKLQYSPTKMAMALEMVRNGAMSKRKAAMTYNVPRTTLLDKLAGRTQEDRVRPGPSTVLTEAEESVLVNYCKLMASIGYPLSRDELLREVKHIMDIDGRQNPFTNNKPGKDWFYAFKRRHPDLSERTAMTLGHQRALVNEAMIRGWYDGLFKYLKEEVPSYEALIKDPRRIFNADESGFPLCFKTGKVIAGTGARHVYQVTTSSKTQLTVMVCFNAFGDYVPPLIVYPGERFRDTGIKGFPEAIYGHTSNGWMDSDLFVSFLHHFSEFVEEKCIVKPVLLFVDGHSTHMSRAAAKFCAENGIVLYCLLPNATHILQPCDVGFFSPMKAAWKRNVKEWQLEHIGESLTKKSFPAVFKAAWESVTTFLNAAHGFRRSGLFPLESSGIDTSKLEPSKVANPPCATNPSADISPDTSGRVDIISQTPTGDNATGSALSQQRDCDVTTAPEDSIILPTPTGDNATVFALSQQRNCDVTNAPEGTAAVASTSQSHVLPSNQSCRKSYVSEAFGSLSVPEPKQRKVVKRINERLPKAISGSAALKIFEEREAKQAADLLAKLKRKEERELKKKEKGELKEKKRQEREAMKQKREENKKLKPKKKRQRKESSSSSSSENEKVKVEYVESDVSFDEAKFCPGRQTDDALDNDDEWIKCVKCPRVWHVSCTGDAILLEIPVEQLKSYPYYCEYCI